MRLYGDGLAVLLMFTWSKISSNVGLFSGCSFQQCFISWIHSIGAWSGDTMGRHIGGGFRTFLTISIWSRYIKDLHFIKYTFAKKKKQYSQIIVIGQIKGFQSRILWGSGKSSEKINVKQKNWRKKNTIAYTVIQCWNWNKIIWKQIFQIFYTYLTYSSFYFKGRGSSYLWVYVIKKFENPWYRWWGHVTLPSKDCSSIQNGGPRITTSCMMIEKLYTSPGWVPCKPG